MSSQDHTYLCKALLARLNQAVAHIQTAENSAVRLLTKLQGNTKSCNQSFRPAERIKGFMTSELMILLCIDQLV